MIPRKNGSPPKKTVAGKVLRNQTRRAAQDEVHQTAAAKLAEHQRELHDQLQTQGLEKFSEEGEGKEGKEGKGWKKFQSYKGEAGLPGDVEKLRVSGGFFLLRNYASIPLSRYMLIARRRPSSCPFTVSRSLSTSIRSRMRAKTTREIAHTYASTSKHLGSWLARKKIQCGVPQMLSVYELTPISSLSRTPTQPLFALLYSDPQMVIVSTASASRSPI